MKDWIWPILILLLLIAVSLTGGVHNERNQSPTTAIGQTAIGTTAIGTTAIGQTVGGSSSSTYTPGRQQVTLNSPYAQKINMEWGGYGNNNPDTEYLEIDASPSNTTGVDITGWRLVSTSTGASVGIPQSSVVYFQNSPNVENQDVILAPGERAFIITGHSPIGYSFRANVCSGYLSQYYQFTPSLYTNCPAAASEDTSSIPHTYNNNNCFVLINSAPTCRVEPALGNSYSAECQNFFNNNINYTDCISNHHNDTDFWSPKEWYVYLKRSQVLWQGQYEQIILVDQSGKAVTQISN